MRAKLLRLASSPFCYPAALLGLTGLAYGLLFPWLGFYWDEWPMTWIAQRLGDDGLARYFATNRPYWGMIYRITTPLLGAVPWRWQLFGLFWRWFSAVALWGGLRRVFPHQRAHLAASAGVLFLLYPGFGQQSIGMMYGHFFVVFSAYLLSVWLSLAALTGVALPRWRFLLLTVSALALSLLNLLAMEYFFLLELLRPLLFWAALTLHTGQAHPRAVLRRAALYTLPYLALFGGVGAWRAFFFPYQTQNYRPETLAMIGANPLTGLLSLAATVLRDLWRVSFEAVGRAFILPNPAELGLRTTLVYAGVTLAAGLLTGYALLGQHRTTPPTPDGSPRAAIILGVIGLLTAGIPFWLTGLPIALDYPNDRFTLPFMLGFALLFAGLLSLIPRWRALPLLLMMLIAGLSAGLHFEQSSAFRRDWNMHRALFWQMSWRAPGFTPGTTIISSDLPLRYYSDNSLTGPLNWVYAPDNRSMQMSYMFYYASIRSERRLLFQPAQPIRQDYLAASFTGSTDQMVALIFHPPACLRILDPDLDPVNAMLPEQMRQAAALSSSQWVLPTGALDLTPEIFGAEPARSWCYYFESAALAAGQGKWQQVAALGEQAFALDDYPNDPMERVPFIEGYAHTANWLRALELSREAGSITPLMQPVLCRLWQRIERDTPASQEQQAAISEARAAHCP